MKNANPLYRVSWLLVVMLSGCVVTGCGRKADERAVVKSAESYFAIKVGERAVQMQLAVQPLEMQRGLMARRDLGANQGMIFVYSRPERLSFYMRNTPTPLDIGFFDRDGVLREVYPMYPFDEKTVSSRSDRIQFALEMNQGWYKDAAMKPGTQLDLKALITALKARGFRPEAFGLIEQP